MIYYPGTKLPMLVFINPDGTKTIIARGDSGFLDLNGKMHAADEIPGLFEYSDEQLTNMGIQITFLGDELTDFYNCGGSLIKYLGWLKSLPNPFD